MHLMRVLCPSDHADHIALKLRPYLMLEWERLAKVDENSVPARSGQPRRVFDKVAMPCKRASTPQQDNCSDCGCFLLIYIKVSAHATTAAHCAGRVVL